MKTALFAGPEYLKKISGEQNSAVLSSDWMGYCSNA